LSRLTRPTSALARLGSVLYPTQPHLTSNPPSVWKWFYDTFTDTAIIAAWFVIEGTKTLTRKLDEHENLRGLNRWSVISYIHRRYCIVVCVALMKTEFNLRKVDVV
jgi:hypothetical protein